MTLARTKKVARFFAGFVIPFAILGVLFLGLWANGVREDRKHTVTVNAPTRGVGMRIATIERS
jgi:hypothetical protein